MAKPENSEDSQKSPEQLITEDALELAEIIYDIYMDDTSGGKIEHGQNNVQSSDT